MSKRAIGIDLGTTNSCVGVKINGRIEIIPNEDGHRTTPSYVAFTENSRLVGNAAKVESIRNAKNTIFCAKRMIGRSFDDVKNDTKYWPFNVIDHDKKLKIQCEYKKQNLILSPEEVSSMILTKMKRIAENHLGEKVTDAVITVPAYFNDSQRRATRNAGAVAGLNVLRIINEPTAAAIAYGLNMIPDGFRQKNVLIFDLGGGTFDISLLILDGAFIQIKSTCGDTHLGGEDIDQRLTEYFINKFKEEHGHDISGDVKSVRRLTVACEEAKCRLSTDTETTIEVNALFNGIDFTSTITRAKFENLCSDLFKRILEPLKSCIKRFKN